MLILALDVTDGKRAVKIAKETSEHISAIKVNYPLVLSTGIEIVKKLSDLKPVIADFKIADIPYTSSLIAEIAFTHGARGVIVHGLAGSDTVKAVKEVADRYGGDVYLVTELSSKGGEEFMRDCSDRIVEMAVEMNVAGLIAPATRPERVAEIKKAAKRLRVICPGVLTQGGSIEDVLKAGADGIIVGRAIYNSPTPGEEAMRINELITSFLKKYK